MAQGLVVLKLAGIVGVSRVPCCLVVVVCLLLFLLEHDLSSCGKLGKQMLLDG